MKFHKWTLAVAAGLALTGVAIAQEAATPDQATLVRAARPPAKPITAWAAKSTKLQAYEGPNNPNPMNDGDKPLF